jgi:hypothetical protein
VLSGEKWSRDTDINGFASILFGMIVEHPVMLSGVVNDENISRIDILV